MVKIKKTLLQSRSQPVRVYPPKLLSDVEIGLKSQFSLGNVDIRMNLAAFRGIYSNIHRTTAESVKTSAGQILLATHRSQMAPFGELQQ